MSIEDAIRQAVRDELAKLAQPREWLTPEQVAEDLGIAPSTVYAKITRGSIPAHKWDSRLYVSRSELDAVLRTAPAPDQAA